MEYRWSGVEYRSIGVLAPDGGWVREEGGQGGDSGEAPLLSGSLVLGPISGNCSIKLMKSEEENNKELGKLVLFNTRITKLRVCHQRLDTLSKKLRGCLSC